MNHAKWINHFHRNRLNRPEPDWDAPITVPPHLLKPFLSSLEQFRLGESLAEKACHAGFKGTRPLKAHPAI